MDCGSLNAARANGSGRIIWLASYPKSGNTWVRLVIGHLMGKVDSGKGVDAMISDDGIACSRSDFDAVVAVDASELSLDQVDCLRPRVYEQMSLQAKRSLFIKAHDAYLPTQSGEPLFPCAATQGVVHIVRNPLDVVVSLAHHFGISVDAAIECLCCTDYTWCDSSDRLNEQLRQRLLDWSGHTSSWLESGLPRLTIRYEDMLSRPLDIFTQVALFCGLDASAKTISAAVEACHFDTLRKLEKSQRFSETPAKVSHFFRAGRAGGWKSILASEQVERILESQGYVMGKFGYAVVDGEKVAGRMI